MNTLQNWINRKTGRHYTFGKNFGNLSESASLPDQVHHIDQIQVKRVRIRDDVIERFAEDPRWKNQHQLKRMSTVEILAQLAGQEYPVVMAWRIRGVTMYGIQLDKPIIAPDETGTRQWMDRCQICADYTQVLDSGFMEAR